MEGRFGNRSFLSQVSLTDQFMNLVAGNCRNLQSLKLSYNRQITSAGWLTVAEACPLLRNIVAFDTGLKAIHLEELVRGCSPQLLRICFSPPNDKSAMEKATTASQGCTLFIWPKCRSLQAHFQLSIPGEPRKDKENAVRSPSQQDQWME